MPISVLTNFTINQAAPMDDRLVVTNSTSRDALSYKYDGLTVFKTDDRTSWTYNLSSATWSLNVSGNGIYSGNGSLSGDTNVFTGNIANPLSSVSKKFIMSASSSSSGIYFTSYFNRNLFGTDWTNVEWKMQYSHDADTTDISYITLNSYDSSLGNSGGIEFGTKNQKRFSITNTGLVKLWSPTYSASIDTSNLTANQTYILPTKNGTFAMTSDTTLQSVLTNNNSATSSIFLRNTVAGVGVDINTITATISSFSNAATGFAASLDGMGQLKLADSGSGNIATIRTITSGLTGNFTYSIPNGGGTFQMRKYVIYQKSFTSGSTFTTSFFTTDSNSGRFIITRVIYMVTSVPSPLPMSGTQPTINIGFTSTNYNDLVSAYNGDTTPNKVIFLATGTIGSTINSIAPSTTIYLKQTSTGTYVNGYDIYIEGFYNGL